MIGTAPAAMLVLAALAQGPSTPGVYNGRNHELDVRPPRIDASIEVDGLLNEPVWRDAARLTGFSRYAPTDGEAADDSTDVLVWYSPTAIHFGIRAFAEPGSVHATLADRDRMFSDDYIGIFLSTFNDGRQALVFGANPLGVQGDGIVVESGQSTGSFTQGPPLGREPTDISPDYLFQSKGHVTPWGYEIEIRIPFKSFRYQSVDPQTWGINIIRKVQSRGYEYSWAPARRAAASYLRQHGRLAGLTDLRRGIVMDVNPVVTAHANGKPGPDGYDYTRSWQPGANVRWGINSDVTLSGTVRPDFAEVESDAGQFTTDPRQALYFSEKRPFFLEGREQFQVPSNLIYTRRILSPLFATKVTGRVAGTSIAYLGAVDDTLGSATFQQHPIFNILRVTRDIGPALRAGFVLTDKEDGSQRSNRVAGVDMRLVFGRIYSAQFQGAMSSTRAPGQPARSGPLWAAAFGRTGRTFALRYSMSGLHQDFRTSSGFISRLGIAHANATHGLTFYGRPGGLLTSVNGNVVGDLTWQYQKLIHGQAAIEQKAHFNTNTTLRGGWQIGASVLVERFGFDDALYAGYAIERHQGAVVDTIPFTGVPWINNLDYVLSVSTPQFRHVGFSMLYIWGRDENFYEWASADIGFLQTALTFRPTDRLRLEATYNYQFYNRRTDGSTVGRGRIPRVKLEYQLNRATFLRVVAQYTSIEQDSLRDDTRTNDPILFSDGAGGYVRAAPQATNRLQTEWLMSFLPSPGTVIYLGYGGFLHDDRAFRFEGLRRERDTFFVKASYLIRL